MCRFSFNGLEESDSLIKVRAMEDGQGQRQVVIDSCQGRDENRTDHKANSSNSANHALAR